MKKKYTLLLLLVAALACFLFACGSGNDVNSIDVVDFDKTEYAVGDTIDYDSIKLKITYEDGSTSTKTVKEAKASVTQKADLSKAGNTSFTIKLDGATKVVQLTVVGEEEPEVNISVETFAMPTFWTEYLTRSAATTGDNAFKTQNVTYEVGNANSFVVEPTITGFDENDERVTYSTGVKTIATFETCDTENGSYTALTGDALSAFVTVKGNSYKFSSAAADKYVKLHIAIDKEEYDVPDTIVDDYTLSFKVVDNGYNVYNQAGLAVMTDLIMPEFWADILGCTVENGEYVPTDNPLKLISDDQPLYTYIGNVDWLIFHGNVTVTANNLPAKYFRSTSDADYNTAASSLAAAEHREQMLALLDGSLQDGDGQGNIFRTTKDEIMDSNGQKGIYASSKINISGNYNSITVDNSAKAGERKIKSVVALTTAENPNLMICWWSLFKMFDADRTAPVTDFTVKNIALKGNTGRTENLNGAQGIGMINSFSNSMTVNNIVADSFYMNLNLDNYAPANAEFDNTVRIYNSKINNTYNTMSLAWRGNIDVKNSSLKNPGGPLFLLSDGVSEKDTPNNGGRPFPTVTYDEDCELEAYANGTESWYVSLGNDKTNGIAYATAMFTQLNQLNTGLSQISGKTFFHASPENPSAGKGYASILSIIYPDASNAFSWPTDDENSHAWQLVSGLVTTPNDTYSMADPVLQAVHETGTVLFKSGEAYAMVVPVNGANTIMSPEMAAKLSAYAAQSKAYIDTDEYNADMLALVTAWRTKSTDTLCVWMQSSPGNPLSPRLQIVFGSFVTETAA